MLRWRNSLLYGVLFSVFCGTAGALDTAALVAENEAAVVVIVGTKMDTGALWQGSGCCVDTRGYILTVAHQVVGVQDLVARQADGTSYSLTVAAVDESMETALVKTDRPMPKAVRLGDPGALRSGAALVAIAAPVGLDFSTVTGVVSSTRRTYRGHPVIQADLPASHGSSGGPVFNAAGELIGTVEAMLDEKNLAMTLVNPLSNAYPLLEAAGIPLPGRPAAQEMELLPAADLTEAEWAAIRAYNTAVLSAGLDQKIAAYQRAVVRLPLFFEAWFNLAVAFAKAGRLEEAAEAYRNARMLRPASVAVLRNLGRLYLRGNDLANALACFEEAAAAAPGEATSHNDHGEALRRLKRYAEAEAEFKKALALRPGYAAAQYNLGLVYAAQGRAAEAIESFERYLVLSPGAADAAEVRRWIAQLQDS